MSGRSKYASDIFHRLWDSHNSRWVRGTNGQSVWVQSSTATRLRQKMIDAGRDPATLHVEAVWVNCK